MTSPFDVQGRVAIVTGGTKGLGEAITRGLAAGGARVAVCSRNQLDCDAVAESVSKSTGTEVIGIACAMEDWNGIPAFVDRVYDHFGRVDILVNNAGVNPAPAEIVAVTEELWDEVQAINVKGPLRTSGLVAPRMAQNGGGSIVNVGSMGGMRASPMNSPYGASKAALVQLTQTMASEWAKHRVRVNCVNPGPFLTPLMLFGEEVQPGKIASCESRTLLGRLGEPDEFVGAVLYMASDASSYVTGETLNVAGGMI